MAPKIAASGDRSSRNQQLGRRARQHSKEADPQTHQSPEARTRRGDAQPIGDCGIQW